MLENKKIVAIIQARMGSSRLPGKVMKDLMGKPQLLRVVERISQAQVLDQVIVATSTNPLDDVIEMKMNSEGIEVFRGSEEDVLGRYYEAALKANADIVVRVCADNPWTEPLFIDLGVKQLLAEQLDYISPERIVLGSNVWTMSFTALEKAYMHATEPRHREHVVPYIAENTTMFKIQPLNAPKIFQRPEINVSVDTLEDYCFAFRIFYHFRSKDPSKLPLEEIISFWDSGRNSL